MPDPARGQICKNVHEWGLTPRSGEKLSASDRLWAASDVLYGGLKKLKYADDLWSFAKGTGKVPPQLLRGMQFEKTALGELGLKKNSTKIGNSIPDSLIGGRITEVKDVKYIYRSRQFRDYIRSGMPIDLVVSERSKVSKPLIDAIINSGGSIRKRLDSGEYANYLD